MRYVLAVVLLAAAIGAAAWHSVGKIERALSSEVEAAVAAADAPGATVVVDGLDATLSGEVADSEAKARVEEAVARVPGVRQMLSQITVAGGSAPAAEANTADNSEAVSELSGSEETAVSFGEQAPSGGVALGARIDPETTAAAEQCRTQLDAILAMDKIDFASSSSELEASNLPLLAAAAAILGECPAARVEIAGHTDASGPRDDNLQLSAQRAEAVRAALEANGIAGDRLTAVGYGPDEPLVDNATPEGRAENRRIEFRILAQP